MIIQGGQQKVKTFTQDTKLQRTSSVTVYFTDDNTKGLNEWFQLNSDIPVATVPTNTTWYFYSQSDATLAEVSVV